jgi:hypothetical protein
MAYPFLPVNPCCTDVVINDPCGCSSTITNSSCNNNNPCSTHLTISSTIVYDGPELPCIVAEPCDTLNVVLQKIDEIICTLITQINYLTNQVTNITNQVIDINGDIINIYNTLGECCSATTTSTSTTVRPCENFSLSNTGDDPVAIIVTDCTTQEQEAIVLMPGDTNICVITDSPLTVPGTVIVTPNGPCAPLTTTTTSSSTTSSTSSTTTTTTTAIPCECLTFSNSDSVSHSISYEDCTGTLISGLLIDAYETIKVCGCCGLADSEFVTINIGANCIDDQCPTTTTTTTAELSCIEISIDVSTNCPDQDYALIQYTDCEGNVQTVETSSGELLTFCMLNYPPPVYLCGTGGFQYGEACALTTTTTTTIPCSCVDIIISQADIDDATGNTTLNGNVNVEGTNGKQITCENEDIVMHYDTAGTYSYCLKSSVIPTIELTYTKNNIIVTDVQSQVVNLETLCLVNGECAVTTTTTTTLPVTTTSTTTTIAPTTTTTTSIFCDCYVYEVTVTEEQLEDSDNGIVYVYVDEACFSNEYYTFLFNKAGTETICVSRTNPYISQYIEIDSEITPLPDPIKLNECCLAPMFISTESKATNSPDTCTYELTTTLYIKTVGLNKYAYINPEGTIPFDGLNRWWHIQILGDASGYVEIRTDGRVEYPITYC